MPSSVALRDCLWARPQKQPSVVDAGAAAMRRAANPSLSLPSTALTPPCARYRHRSYARGRSRKSDERIETVAPGVLPARAPSGGRPLCQAAMSAALNRLAGRCQPSVLRRPSLSSPATSVSRCPVTVRRSLPSGK
jgi:hypothetical protein